MNLHSAFLYLPKLCIEYYMFFLSSSIGFDSHFTTCNRISDTTSFQIKGAVINTIDVNSILNDSNLSEGQKADSILNMLKRNYQGDALSNESTAKRLCIFR